MTITEIREMLGISRAEYARRYHIPLRTVEDWEYGRRKPPVWLPYILERLAKMDMKYGHGSDE